MSMTQEEATKILDLRRRMLQNVAEGKPSSEGIDIEVLKGAIDSIRGGRVQTAVEAAKKTKAAKAAANPIDTSNFDGGVDLD